MILRVREPRAGGSGDGLQTTNQLSQGLTSQGNRPPYLNKLQPKSHLGSLSGAWSPKGNF